MLKLFVLKSKVAELSYILIGPEIRVQIYFLVYKMKKFSK